MALFIRTFPKEIQKGLKVKAAEKGQTLTSLIIDILKVWLEENQNVRN